MSLDIKTPKGQISLENEKKMVQVIESLYPGHQFASTNKDKAADVDGILIKNSVMVAVIESKCRNANTKTLKESWNDEWLLTYEKIQKGCQIAKSLQIPYVGFLYLLEDESIYSIKIADENGQLLPEITLKKTETQATINGGQANRVNAFIKMTNAKQIKKAIVEIDK